MNALLPIVASIITELLKRLPADLAKRAIDDLLDRVESFIEDSETQLDDVLLLPLIAKAREVLSIPDDIGGDVD